MLKVRVHFGGKALMFGRQEPSSVQSITVGLGIFLIQGIAQAKDCPSWSDRRPACAVVHTSLGGACRGRNR